jgi:RNA polymerase sigma-70 factor (ECF subfamily)
VDDLTPLLVAAADGDRRALNDLVAGSQADVWRFCCALLGPSLADDATQETFVRAWRAAGTFRAEASARTWLLSIARRACYDQLRRHRRHVPLDESEVPDRSGEAGDVVDLYDMINRLDPDRRAAFVLTQLHGLSYQEAAEVCDCAIGTIRSRVARARLDLLRGYEAGEAAPNGGSGG